jgi:hypothetical protein
MAKGKITPYDPGNFSPSATGVPGEDRSGQILAQGINAIGAAIAKREDTTSTLEAMDQFGSFDLAYQQQKLDLQKQFKDDPAKYPTAVKEMSQKIADQFSQGMSGDAVKKFRQMTSSSLAQDTGNLAKWSFQRDNEIQVGRISSIKQNLAIKASTINSAEGLQILKQDFVAASAEATKLIDKESDTKLTQTYWELAKKQAMAAQVFSSPMKVMRDLEGGAYDNILDADERLTWKGKARDAIYNRAEDDQFRTMFMAQGKLLDFQNGIEDGTVSIADLITERDAMAVNKNKVDALGKPVIDPNYIKGLDNLIDIVMYANQRLPANKEARKEALAKFDTEWEGYLTEKKQISQGPSEKDVAKELEIYANLSSLYQTGVITKSDFDQKAAIMRTKLALRQGQVPRVKSFSEVVDQAGTVPKLWWRQPGNDVVSLGYQMIKDYVDKAYPELDTAGRQDIKAQMLSSYHQKIQKVPEEQMKSLATETDRRNFARQFIVGMPNNEGRATGGILAANVSYTDSNIQRTFQVGDTFTKNGATKVFAGKDLETGKPMWKLAPDSLDKIVTIKNRKFRVAGLNANGDFMLKEVKDGE